jgi:UDP-2,4-diacetamido-2,4,6-trideoxy-beta-L-altropyranose hydrolase
VNVVFRVDASYRIGSGHVSRCLSLAKVLADHGVQSSFVCRHVTDALAARIRSRAHELIRLPTAPGNANAKAEIYADRHESAQGEDAQQTKEALRGRHCDWIIVDHYSLDFRWEMALREIAARVMVIDDLADRRHDCDLLLDQNYYSDLNSRYEDLLNSKADRLLGPRYALLDPQFALLRANAVAAQEARLFVSVGASDPFRICMKTIDSLQRFAPRSLAAEVVAGSDSAAADDARMSAIGLHNVTVHGYIDDIAAVMSRCTLAVGAGGSSTWERCAIGVPSLVVITADNQRQMAVDLAQTGVIVVLGEGKDVSTETIYAALADLRGDAARRSRMRRDGMNLVDGEGTYRVTKRILEMAQCTN